ncbi:hypothetical protein [Aquimarina sediminis]|uniref:hypothetical protein n=1 Tax=Aquimarina sediminis TaxID=2070536 RepID=UPI000CA02A89|nr:hypothetical protein [Aquimarina sediminis]
MKKLLIIVIVITLTGCGNGYFFETKATYQASASNLNVDVTAVGHVLDGDDLTDGEATGMITSSKFSDTIYFKANTIEFTLIGCNEDKITNPTSFTTSLVSCLDRIRYSGYNKQELVELGEVIQSTAYGPKGTYVHGQTNLIKVIRVNFETNRGYAKNDE